MTYKFSIGAQVRFTATDTAQSHRRLAYPSSQPDSVFTIKGYVPGTRKVVFAEGPAAISTYILEPSEPIDASADAAPEEDNAVDYTDYARGVEDAYTELLDADFEDDGTTVFNITINGDLVVNL